jgi:hypothetical protein
MPRNTNIKTFKFKVEIYTDELKNNIQNLFRYRTCQEIIDNHNLSKSSIYTLIHNKDVYKYNNIKIIRINESAIQYLLN